MRKRTKFVLLTLLGFAVAIALTVGVMVRPDNIRVVLEQVITNASGDLVSTFKLQNDEWDSRVSAQFVTVGPNRQGASYAPLALTNASGFRMQHDFVKRGDSVHVSCIHQIGDGTKMMVTFLKLDIPLFYQHMINFNRHAYRKWRLGKQARLPLVFKANVGETIDLNYELRTNVGRTIYLTDDLAD